MTTVDRVEQWFLTFGWAGNGKVRNGSLATSKASCKVMVTGLTIMWEERTSSTPAAGAHVRRKFFDVDAEQNILPFSHKIRVDAPVKRGSRSPEGSFNSVSVTVFGTDPFNAYIIYTRSA